jgi:hypothetical protein
VDDGAICTNKSAVQVFTLRCANPISEECLSHQMNNIRQPVVRCQPINTSPFDIRCTLPNFERSRRVIFVRSGAVVVVVTYPAGRSTLWLIVLSCGTFDESL